MSVSEATDKEGTQVHGECNASAYRPNGSNMVDRAIRPWLRDLQRAGQHEDVLIDAIARLKE